MIRPTSLACLRHQLAPTDRVVAWLLALGYIVLLFATDTMGYTRDESFYFHAAREYAGWFSELASGLQDGTWRASFEQASIDRHWAYNPEHPVLVKTTFALSYLVFDRTLGWMTPEDAMRFPAFLFAGWLVAWLYLFTLEVTGRRFAALMATLSFALLPRWFFHAHLTCFDVPMTAVWFAIVYAYWKSFDSTKWAWATGALWGVGLITKLNAFFIPLVFLAHWGLRNVPKWRIERRRIVSPPVPFALFTMALLGPVIFYLGWPRHWFDTFNRIRWYLNFHLTHEHYFVWFFGESLWEPPFPVSFPFVMTLTTTTLAFLFLSVLGFGVLCAMAVARRRSGHIGDEDRFGTTLLLLLNIAVPFAIIAQPGSPVFGGIKHWFPALPYLAMVGGIGIAWLVDRLPTDAVGRTAARLVLAAAIVVPSALATRTSQDVGTAYYNELVGGYTGAADRQGMRQFWGYAARLGLPWLNEHAPTQARVHFHNSTGGSVDMYRRMDLLRDDLRVAWSLRDADVVMFHHQKSFAPFEYAIWQEFGTQAPAHVESVNGVPMLSIYVRPAAPESSEDSPDADDEADDEPASSPTPVERMAPDYGRTLSPSISRTRSGTAPTPLQPSSPTQE